MIFQPKALNISPRVFDYPDQYPKYLSIAAKSYGSCLFRLQEKKRAHEVNHELFTIQSVVKRGKKLLFFLLRAFLFDAFLHFINNTIRLRNGKIELL